MTRGRAGSHQALHLLVAALLGAVVPFPAPAAAEPVVIDFEDLPAWEEVTDQYVPRGVEFNGPQVVDYSEPAPDFPHSGTQAIEPCFAEEFTCTTPVGMGFAQPQALVRVWAGYRGVLKEAVAVQLRAFDSSGELLAEDEAQLGPSPQGTTGRLLPVPIATPLEVAVEDNAITAAEVRLAAGDNRGLAVDDVEFERVVAVLRLKTATVRFDDTAIDDTSEQTLTATNTGTGPATLGRARLDSDTFTITDDTCSDQTLPPAATCHLRLRFRPTTTGTHQATLDLPSDAPGSPASATLGGLGVDVEVPTVTVPDLVGGNIDDARERVEAAGLWLGPLGPQDGVTVVAQDPPAGTLVPPGTPVRVTLAPAPVPWWERLLSWLVAGGAALSLLLLIAAGLAAAGGAVLVRWLRERRWRRRVEAHLRVVPADVPPPEITVSEDDGGTSHVLRLVTHVEAATDLEEELIP